QALFGVWSVPKTYTIDALFHDTNNSFADASAPRITHTDNQGPTTVTSVVGAPLAPIYGQQVTLTASLAANITPNVAGALKPGGTATFTLDPGTTPVSYSVAVNAAAGTSTLGPASVP